MEASLEEPAPEPAPLDSDETPATDATAEKEEASDSKSGEEPEDTSTPKAEEPVDAGELMQRLQEKVDETNALLPDVDLDDWQNMVSENAPESGTPGFSGGRYEEAGQRHMTQFDERLEALREERQRYIDQNAKARAQENAVSGFLRDRCVDVGTFWQDLKITSTEHEREVYLDQRRRGKSHEVAAPSATGSRVYEDFVARPLKGFVSWGLQQLPPHTQYALEQVAKLPKAYLSLVTKAEMQRLNAERQREGKGPLFTEADKREGARLAQKVDPAIEALTHYTGSSVVSRQVMETALLTAPYAGRFATLAGSATLRQASRLTRRLGNTERQMTRLYGQPQRTTAVTEAVRAHIKTTSRAAEEVSRSKALSHVRGAAAERATEKLLYDHTGYKFINGKTTGNQGIDLIAYKKNLRGEIVDVRVIETKYKATGGKPKLAYSKGLEPKPSAQASGRGVKQPVKPAKVQQLSDQWLEKQIDRLKQTGNSEAANLLEKNVDKVSFEACVVDEGGQVQFHSYGKYDKNRRSAKALKVE